MKTILEPGLTSIEDVANCAWRRATKHRATRVETIGYSYKAVDLDSLYQFATDGRVSPGGSRTTTR